MMCNRLFQISKVDNHVLDTRSLLCHRMKRKMGLILGLWHCILLLDEWHPAIGSHSNLCVTFEAVQNNPTRSCLTCKDIYMENKTLCIKKLQFLLVPLNTDCHITHHISRHCKTLKGCLHPRNLVKGVPCRHFLQS